MAAVELPVPRGKLKLRIKTFLGNPLCRGVDELCTELADTRKGCVLRLLDALKQHADCLKENLELKTREIGRGDEIVEMQKENFRLDCLLNYHSKERSAVLAISDQRESALMHYNELQSRSAEVEAMAMDFEQRVADAVAKAGLRAKPGPKKKAGTKGTIGRGKANDSEWVSGKFSVENPTSEMATPRSRKKDEEDNLSTPMEL